MSDARSILLIDGHDNERQYYAQRLQASSADYDVVQAATGQSGLDICARQQIDCVILEIDLPDMSGFEVLVKLNPHPRHPDIAVIVLTGLSNYFLLELALKNGAQAALHKTMTCGDTLDIAILKVLSHVRKEKAQRGHCPQERNVAATPSNPFMDL
jgi:PleD family two-component response regulator